jgi:hypothetical protein
MTQRAAKPTIWRQEMVTPGAKRGAVAQAREPYRLSEPGKRLGGVPVGGDRAQPQEAASDLPGERVEGQAPWRPQAGTWHEGADGAAAGAQPALEPGLRQRCHGVRPAVPPAVRRRRRHARVPGPGRGHVAVGRSGGPRARCDRGPPGKTTGRSRRQWHRADLNRDPALVAGARDRLALHRAGQAAAEQLCGKLQRPAPRRMPS